MWKNRLLSWALIAVLLLSLLGAGGTVAGVVPARAAAPGDLFFDADGDLIPGEINTPSFPVFTSRQVNLKVEVPDAVGDGTIDLTFRDGTGAATFSGQIRDGETLWMILTVKPGNNVLELENTSGGGGPTLDYNLWVYELDQAPFAWSGVSQGAGTWRSHIRLNMPSSGLYDFDFGLLSGRYQFLVDDDYIQKTVASAGTVTYYVPAGLHDLYIEPDTDEAETSWSLDISAPGAAADTLPYVKLGGDLGGPGNDFDREWLPLNLAAATEANFELALTGAGTDALDVHVYSGLGTTEIYSITEVYGGETVWWTADLPAGVSRVELLANAGNGASLAYDLTVHAKPGIPTGWAGKSLGNGNNSQVRFEVATAGLYDLNYGVTDGRYQLLVDSDALIQKTVEATGAVRYYLDAGTHELTVVQDSVEGAAWSLDIAATGEDYDTLPYTKTGGNLGGAGNDFDQEQLPLYVEAGGPANFELTLDGDLADGLVVSLYQGTTEVYSTPLVYGGETFWWTADLAAGLNQIEIETAAGNAAALGYDLAVRPIPSPTTAWSGVAKSGAGNSVALVNIASDGTYSVSLDTPTGFAQVLIDGATLRGDRGVPATGHSAEFLVPLAAGNHSFQILQDAAYQTTEWEVEVASAVPGELIAQFGGNLDGGVTVKPQLPLFGTQDKEVNLRLAVGGGGGPLDLSLTDGLGGSTALGTARDGEVVWATATLKPEQNTFTLVNTGGTALTYDLSVYEIGEAPYDWAGDSVTAGDWDSHIKLNFATAGLYDFDFGLLSGRYQFLVDDEYVQKTVEADGQVGYYVPAGDHVLTIVPDRTGATSWTLDISGVGAGTDTLPYVKLGGDLGGPSNVFGQEWLPLNLAAAAQANFELTLAGAGTDALDVHVYSGLGTTEIYSITDVYGGETVWWTADLPAGVSRLQLLADAGNAASLAYTLTIHAKPGVPAGWAGKSLGNGNNSQVRFEVATAGLYDLDYGVTAGRYQFLVDSDALIQKTVEATGAVRYYLGAGTHELTVVQDSVEGAAWSLDIAAAGQGYDTLPYTKTGGNLGGAGNDFDQEQLPLYVEAGGPANFELTLDGDLADGLMVSLYQGATEVYSTPLVYGGETFWWTADLAAGLNQIEIETAAGNAAALGYDLTVYAVPMVAYDQPFSWSGVSKGNPAPVGSSEVDIQVPVSGTYHVVLDIPNGYATMRIEEPVALTQDTRQSHIEFDVPLDEGSYLFRVLQSSAYVTTTWTSTVSLKSALAPEIVAIQPVSMTNDVAHLLTIDGANFQPGATVALDSQVLGPVTRLDSGTLQVTVPAGLAQGTYDVTVTNPDSQSATLPNALQVGLQRYYIYLPLTMLNWP